MLSIIQNLSKISKASIGGLQRLNYANGLSVRNSSSKCQEVCKEGGYKPFKNVVIFLALPVIVLFTIKCFRDEPRPRVPFVPYEYLRRRTKRYPWRDGRSNLFYNPEQNPLIDGYEDGQNEWECDD